MEASTIRRAPETQHWPVLKSDAKGHPIGGILEIGIGKDDLRVLAAQFEAKFLEVRARRLKAGAAHGGGAGEGQHVDVHMFRQCLADGAARAGHHVVAAIGQARLLQDLAKDQRRGRSDLRRFGDDGAARGKDEGHAFAENEEGEVPGRDESHDADGLTGDEAEHLVPEIVEAVAVERASDPGGIAEDRDAAPHLAARLRDRFAVFQRFPISDLFGAGVENVSGLE